MLYLYPGFQFFLSGLVLFCNRAFIAPQIHEIYLGLVEKITQKNPAVLEKFQGFVLFRLSERIRGILDDWQQIWIPVFFVLVIFCFRLVRKASESTEKSPLLLLSFAIPSAILLFAVLDMLLTGINAAVLLPNAMKYGP